MDSSNRGVTIQKKEVLHAAPGPEEIVRRSAGVVAFGGDARGIAKLPAETSGPGATLCHGGGRRYADHEDENAHDHQW